MSCFKGFHRTGLQLVVSAVAVAVACVVESLAVLVIVPVPSVLVLGVRCDATGDDRLDSISGKAALA